MKKIAPRLIEVLADLISAFVLLLMAKFLSDCLYNIGQFYRIQIEINLLERDLLLVLTQNAVDVLLMYALAGYWVLQIFLWIAVRRVNAFPYLRAKTVSTVLWSELWMALLLARHWDELVVVTLWAVFLGAAVLVSARVQRAFGVPRPEVYQVMTSVQG